MPAIIQCDVAIVGGGLAGGLIALALRTKRPDVDIRLIEPGAIGGEHVWSFFSSDVAEADRWLAAPLVSYRWPGVRRRVSGAPPHARRELLFDRVRALRAPSSATRSRPAS